MGGGGGGGACACVRVLPVSRFLLDWTGLFLPSRRVLTDRSDLWNGGCRANPCIGMHGFPKWKSMRAWGCSTLHRQTQQQQTTTLTSKICNITTFIRGIFFCSHPGSWLSRLTRVYRSWPSAYLQPVMTNTSAAHAKAVVTKPSAAHAKAEVTRPSAACMQQGAGEGGAG